MDQAHFAVLWDKAGELRLSPLMQSELKAAQGIAHRSLNINQAVHAMNAASQPESSLDIAKIAPQFLDTCTDLKSIVFAARREVSSCIGGEVGYWIEAHRWRARGEPVSCFSSGTLDSSRWRLWPAKAQGGSGGGHAHSHSGGEFLAVPFFAQAIAEWAPKSASEARWRYGTSAAATGRAIHAMERTARRSPEVVVRITGRQNGGGHILANFRISAGLAMATTFRFRSTPATGTPARW
jgi:hypothetical protein